MPDDLGSVGEEAARLADAVAGWARGEGQGRVSQAVGHMGTGEPACCVCPVCTVIVLLRGERPELTGRLAESLAGLVTAGQGLLETLAEVTADVRADPAAAPHTTPQTAAQTAPGHDPSSPRRVQDIPLDDD